MGEQTGGTAGNALALFPPAVVWRCLLTTHDAANEHCFFLPEGERDIFTSLWKIHSGNSNFIACKASLAIRFSGTLEVIFLSITLLSFCILIFFKTSYIHIRVSGFFPPPE